MTTDAVFGALANPVRRQLLELLIDGPRTAGALAAEFERELSRPAISEHLQVLRRAELVRDTITGRERHYELSPEPFDELSAWLHRFERYWRERLQKLSDVLDEEAGATTASLASDASRSRTRSAKRRKQGRRRTTHGRP